jgi:hypothetical protein
MLFTNTFGTILHVCLDLNLFEYFSYELFMCVIFECYVFMISNEYNGNVTGSICNYL